MFSFPILFLFFAIHLGGERVDIENIFKGIGFNRRIAFSTAMAIAENQFYGHFLEWKMFPELLQEITLVGVIEKVRTIGEQDNGRGIGGYLRTEKYLGPAILPHGRFPALEGFAKNAIEISGTHPRGSLLVQILREI